MGGLFGFFFKYSIVAKETVLPVAGKKSCSVITVAKTKK